MISGLSTRIIAESAREAVLIESVSILFYNIYAIARGAFLVIKAPVMNFISSWLLCHLWLLTIPTSLKLYPDMYTFLPQV